MIKVAQFKFDEKDIKVLGKYIRNFSNILAVESRNLTNDPDKFYNKMLQIEKYLESNLTSEELEMLNNYRYCLKETKKHPALRVFATGFISLVAAATVSPAMPAIMILSELALILFMLYLDLKYLDDYKNMQELQYKISEEALK